MVRGLKLTSTRIHWWLAAKAAAFGAAWFFLPVWAFLFLAIYFYIRPPFGFARFAIPYSVLLYFTITEPRSFWLTILFSILFYLIIGVKDLRIINRRSVHEISVLLLVFLLLEKFYSSVSAWDSFGAVAGALGVGAASFLLAKGLFARQGALNETVQSNIISTEKKDIALSIFALLSFELALAVLFLPLGFLYQSALALVAITVLFEIVLDFLSGKLEQRRTLFTLSVGLALFVAVLGSAQWTL